VSRPGFACSGNLHILVTMNKPRDKQQWQAAYRATAEALERIRAVELAALTDEQALQQIQSLSVAQTPWRPRPDWSGLVEQQALFHPRR
jgi:hypothetical protein